jgi:hypothetical protein
MTCATFRTATLYFATALSTMGVYCSAQSTAPDQTRDPSASLPKLCRPVRYRQPPHTIAIKTLVGMLGDRYQEVSESLSGWNETGVPLVGKYDGDWEPVPCGDDTGLFYLVPLLARQTGWSAVKALNVFLLGTLAFSASIGAVGLWLTVSQVWQRSLAIVPIIVGAFLAFRMGDVYLIQGCAVLLVLPWLFYALTGSLNFPRRAAICFSAGIFLGLAQWIRTQSASPLLLFFVVLLCFSSPRRSAKVLLFAILISGMSLPLGYAQSPLRQRERFLVLHQPYYSPTLNSHLFWHTTYLGLAYRGNTYVSAWRDSAAVSYVQGVDSNAIYGGPEYESILRSRVEQIALLDARFFLYTIFAKVGVLAGLLLLYANLGILVFLFRPKSIGTELAFWLAIAFAALPGIVAIPVPQYVVGMLTIALYYWFYSLVWFGNFFLQTPASQSDDEPQY